MQEHSQVRTKTLGASFNSKKGKPPLKEWGLGPVAGATCRDMERQSSLPVSFLNQDPCHNRVRQNIFYFYIFNYYPTATLANNMGKYGYRMGKRLPKKSGAGNSAILFQNQ